MAGFQTVTCDYICFLFCFKNIMPQTKEEGSVTNPSWKYSYGSADWERWSRNQEPYLGGVVSLRNSNRRGKTTEKQQENCWFWRAIQEIGSAIHCSWSNDPLMEHLLQPKLADTTTVDRRTECAVVPQQPAQRQTCNIWQKWARKIFSYQKETCIQTFIEKNWCNNANLHVGWTIKNPLI